MDIYSLQYIDLHPKHYPVVQCIYVTSFVSPIPLLTVTSEYEAFTDDTLKVRADSTGN